MIARLVPVFLLAFFSFAVSANPCSLGGRPYPVEEGSGMGGTGLKTGEGDGRGTGGTGHQDGSGSGGTGRQARDGDGSGTGGTGVVGVITGFGSVCVNGLEIHYDARTPVVANGSPITSDQLAVGQMVAVEAVGQDTNLVARQIHVQHALIGRVQAVEGEQVKVWGQWVSLPGTQGLKSGDRIKVSGYRLHPGSIYATRIDAALPQEADLISGEVDAVENGVAMINGVRVRMPEGADSVKSGKEIRAIGKPEAGGFKADRLEPGGKPDFLDKVDRLVVQDRIRPGPSTGLEVGGVEFVIDAKGQARGSNVKDLHPGQLVRVEAQRKNGRMLIERIDVRDESKNRVKKEKESGSTDTTRGNGAGNETSKGEERRENEKRDQESREDHEPESGEKPESHEHEMNERSEKYEKEEKSEKVEKTERVEKSEKSEKIEKPEKVEKSEKIEKPEKAEKPEKVEKPERPEKDDD